MQAMIADPGYLSLILIFNHPGSRVLDDRSQIKRQEKQGGGGGGVVICFFTFFVAINFAKL